MSTSPQIILHQLSRGPKAPSLSPFVIKLETFLRMAKLPYTNDFRGKTSPKGKIPWIECDGEVVGDTEFCIQHINRKCSIDLNGHLTPEQRAIARAFQKMVDENLYWCVVLSACENIDYMHKIIKLPKPLIRLGTRKYKSQAKGHGIGRHSFQEMLQIMEGDIKAISDFLGNKKFLFGDRPCETDCAVFGELACFRYQAAGTRGEQLILEHYTNLRDYCDRMRDEFWPDWEECNTNDGTKKATK